MLVFVILFYKKIREIKFAEYKYGLILGVFLSMGFLSQTAGLKYTSASNSAFITGANIVLIPFTQLLLIRKKPKAENIAGILIVLIGLFFLSDISASKLNFGDGLTTICAVSFAFYIVLLDKYSGHTDTKALILGQFIASTVLSLVFTIIFEGFIYADIKFDLNSGVVLSLLFTSLFSTFLGLYLSTTYQKFTTPVRAGLIYNMEQVFAVISAYFILNELLGFRQAIGAMIMISGLVVSEFYGFFTEWFKTFTRKSG